MKLLHRYLNGNYTVSLYDDGTKVRSNNLQFFEPAFPESIDLKITDCCDMGCAMCYENSSPTGRHGNLDLPFLSTLRAGTELAIGGGNPLAHPDLIPFLERMREQGVVCNITVNQKHFEEEYDRIKFLQQHNLIHGVGVSVVEWTFDFQLKAIFFPHLVLHFIAGYHHPDFIRQFAGHHLSALFLGYKRFRRGAMYYGAHDAEIEGNLEALKEEIPSYISDEKGRYFDTVCFDNLAIHQLGIQQLVKPDLWNQCYLGDDGQYTMYVDTVMETFAPTSTAPMPSRAAVLPTIDEMFHHVRNLNLKSD